MVKSVLGLPELAGINQALDEPLPPGTGCLFPAAPTETARSCPSIPCGTRFLPLLCSAGGRLVCAQPSPPQHGVSLRGWACGYHGCCALVDSCLALQFLQRSPLRQFSRALSPDPQWEPVPVSCLVTQSQRVDCFCFVERKPTQGLTQAKPALCCRAHAQSSYYYFHCDCGGRRWALMICFLPSGPWEDLLLSP